MDFHYSPEDEAFRLELRMWLEANAPKRFRDFPSRPDAHALGTEEQKKRYIIWPEREPVRRLRPDEFNPIIHALTQAH